MLVPTDATNPALKTSQGSVEYRPEEGAVVRNTIKSPPGGTPILRSPPRHSGRGSPTHCLMKAQDGAEAEARGVEGADEVHLGGAGVGEHHLTGKIITPRINDVAIKAQMWEHRKEIEKES